jgi:hypothetical protein
MADFVNPDPQERHRHRGRVVMLASCAIILAVACACVPSGYMSTSTSMTTTTSSSYRVQQAALVPAPSGPHAAGPLVARRKLAIEGAASFTTVAPSGETRANGAMGHVVPRGVVRGRIAYGVLEGLELGADIEVASAAWGASLSSDLADDALAPATFIRSGAQLRAIVVGTRRLGLGVNAEASVASVPFAATVVNTTTTSSITTTTVTDPGGNPMTTVSPGPSSTTVTAVGASSYMTLLFARVGLFGTFEPVRWLSILGGVLGQTQPVFFGSLDGTFSCSATLGTTAASTTASGCSGIPAEQIVPVTTSFVATPWLSVGVTAGPIVLYAQGHASVATDPHVVGATPLGGDVGVRAQF